MPFANGPVDPQSLPAVRAIPLAPVSPRFPACRSLSRMLGMLPVIFLAWLFVSMTGLPAGLRPLVAGVVGAGGVVFAVLGWFEARRRAYGLREQDLAYRSGLLVHRTTILPFQRIQHVEIASNPLERAFGLVRIICYTAGGAAADLVVQGLEREAGERLREYLLARVRTLPDGR